MTPALYHGMSIVEIRRLHSLTWGNEGFECNGDVTTMIVGGPQRPIVGLAIPTRPDFLFASFSTIPQPGALHSLRA